MAPQLTTPKTNRYQLLDFGAGRKLESFAGWIVDRPSPAAEGGRRTAPGRWKQAHCRFDHGKQRWVQQTPWPNTDQPQPPTANTQESDWCVDCGGFQMPVQATPYGHVGLFPEQSPNWQWLLSNGPVNRDDRQTEATGWETPERAPADVVKENPHDKGLNLFGYTGASSMAMAISGLQVAHVDAAKPNVNSARRAAAINGLNQHPIRYLVDDSAKFVAREIRRGNRYHTIVMDPPAYGHSPTGKTWRIERDLWPLLENCLELLQRNQFRLLITGHSPQVQAADVLDYLQSKLPRLRTVKWNDKRLHKQHGRLSLIDQEQRKLDAGFFVRLQFT